MSWQVAVSGVFDIIGVGEIVGIVVLVKLIGLNGFVVFDTITVQVGNFSSVPSVLFSLEESKIFRALNVIDQERKSIFGSNLNVLIITEAVCHFIFCVLLGEVLCCQFILSKCLWWLRLLVFVFFGIFLSF